MAMLTLAGLVLAGANAHAQGGTTPPPQTAAPLPAPGAPTVPGGDAVVPLSPAPPPADLQPSGAPPFAPPSAAPPVYAPSPEPEVLIPLAPPPPPPNKPFYKKAWFWGAIGVVALTAGAIWLANSSSGPSTPNTTLGDKRAF
ncbi:MAG TPA: hypothetical protein VGL59_03860 [Polyangia bacterium]